LTEHKHQATLSTASLHFACVLQVFENYSILRNRNICLSFNL